MSAGRLSGFVVWITVLWVLLWADLSVANVASGLVVAVVVTGVAGFPRRVPSDDRTVRIAPLSTAYLVVYVLAKLVEANLTVAWQIVIPGNRRVDTGVVAVPLRTESSLAMMVVGNIITLTPGTITIEVVGTPPVLFVNVLNLNDLDGVRADLLRIEELVVRAFGSRRAREQMAASSQRTEEVES